MIIRPVQIVGRVAAAEEIVVAGPIVAHVGEPSADPRQHGPLLNPGDAIAFPGLVNSHDHLEFNVYPPLGHARYGDYLEWGRDIHRRDRGLIASIEGVPREDRLRWGALKNLLCGVTTVAHHGDPRDDLSRLPIARARGRSIHSVRVDGRWRWKLNAPLGRAPYVFHVGEGTSSEVRGEVAELLRWNLLRRPLVAVHAIAMNASQASAFRALVWCPVSNEFLYGATADVAALKASAPILVGSDSTLTGHWNFWRHLRRARELGGLDDRELFDAVTRTAASAWRLEKTGRIAPGEIADVVVARRGGQPGQTGYDAFYAVEPEDILLVVRRGNVVLLDASLQGASSVPGKFSLVRLGQAEKRVAMDVASIFGSLKRAGIASNLPIAAA